MTKKNPLIVLYGSATGNAEQIAKDLTSKYKDCVPAPFTDILCYEGNEFKRKCLPMWEQEPSCSKYGLLVITSTTGNGDSPDNISRYVRYLKKKTTAESSSMKNVAYAVLALGDSNYDKFCSSGLTVDKKLHDCGGSRVRPISLADEGTGLEDVVEGWIDDIVPTIAKACDTVETDMNEINKNNEDKKKSMERPSQLIEPEKIQSYSSSTNPTVGSRPNVQAFLGSRPDIPQSRVLKQDIQSHDVDKNAYSIEKSNSPLFILYGSATGNAEHIAKELGENYKKMLSDSPGKCFFPSVVCCELNAYKKKCQSFWEEENTNSANKRHGLLVVASTTGNGEAPENASRFVRYIKRKTTVESMPFRHVAYAVLGLGDTNYDQFCATGKTIDTKLKQLGGERIRDLACADEGTGLEQVVDPWVEGIFEVVTNACKEAGSGDRLQKKIQSTPEERKEDESSLESLQIIRLSQVVPNQVSSSPKQSPGLSIVQKLLLSQGGSGAVPSVEESALPSIGTSLSSVQLLDESNSTAHRSSRGHSLAEMENMTISSVSSSNIHYTINRPFQSSILNARYLTGTRIDGAQKASEALKLSDHSNSTEEEKLLRAMEGLQDNFPLSSDNYQSEKDQKHYDQNSKRVIEVTLSLPNDFTLDYIPGDSIGIVPSNSPQSSRFILDMLQTQHGIVPTQHISIDENHPITVSQAIHDSIDLCSPIKNKRVLHVLSQFASDSDEAASLRLLASKDPIGEKLFTTIIEQQCYTVVDILKDFPSCQSITLNGLLAILPGISPRYYSITSSPLTQKDELFLTVAFSVVDFLTPELFECRRRVCGLVTTYMEAICSPFLCNDKQSPVDTSSFSIPQVKIFPKPTGEFTLPPTLEKPLIFIGPGTGIAPFKGFLDHRKAQIAAINTSRIATDASEGTWRGVYEVDQKESSSSSLDNMAECNIGEVDVYFGCRYSDHDWIYENEMKRHLEDGIISTLEVAFSREKESRVYVQDKMLSNAEHLARIIMQKDAKVYICGDGNAMAKDVQNTLIDIFCEHFTLQNDSHIDGTLRKKAENYLEDMKSQGRLLMDIWS